MHPQEDRTSKDALAFIRHAALCTHNRDLWSAFRARMSGYGFDRLLYGFTRLHHGDLADLSAWEIMSSHEESYLRRLLGGDLFRGARMAGWALHNSGTLLWRDASKLPPGDREMEFRLRALDRAHRVEAGVTVSFPPLPQRRRGVLLLAATPNTTQGDVDALWRDHGTEIEAQLHAFHARVLLLPSDAPRLTARQRQVLECVASGLSTRDIAIELGLTMATIDKHLRLARSTLDATTTAQAVLKASLLNQLFE